MATKKWLEKHRKLCIDCKTLVSYRSLRCYSCDNKNKYKLGLKLSWDGIFQKIITKELLIDLYTKQKKNIIEVAKIIGCKKSSVFNYLQKYNISIIKKQKKRKYCSCGKEIKLHNKRCRICHYKFFRGKNHPNFGIITHTKYLKYKEIYMHSSWETAFAKWCDNHNIQWLYESKTFDLGNITYTPDFYLPEFNFYIEVKGFWRDDAKIKFEEFKQKYCGERIKIVDKIELQSIGVL